MKCAQSSCLKDKVSATIENVKLVYTIRRELAKIRYLTRALENGNLSELNDVSTSIQAGTNTFTANANSFFEIYDHFVSSLRALRKKESDWPIHVCISCRKLCPKSDMHKIVESLYEKFHFMELLANHYSYNRMNENRSEADELCTYCFQRLKNDEVPSTCILNNLDFGSVPPEIKNLNEFERILIQRAKAFQVIVRMNTLMGGHNRNRLNESIKKIKGRVFHLPLPLENTLEKLPDATEAIIQNQEQLILVRGIPSKSGKIYQMYVDVQKLYNALLWIKADNPLYREIISPIEVEDLLANVEINECTLNAIENQKNNDNTEPIQVDCEEELIERMDVDDRNNGDRYMLRVSRKC